MLGYVGVVNLVSLFYGDYWLGNVLWYEGCFVVVIDWEDVVFGDLFVDFVVVCVELLCQYDECVMDCFMYCYLEGNDVDFGDLLFWEIYVLVLVLVMMEYWGFVFNEEVWCCKVMDSFLNCVVVKFI